MWQRTNVWPEAMAAGSGVAPGAAGPGPLATLDERLARGEIDVDTYRAVRAELTRHQPSAPGTQQ